jgi:hypothetical protein
MSVEISKFPEEMESVPTVLHTTVQAFVVLFVVVLTAQGRQVILSFVKNPTPHETHVPIPALGATVPAGHASH